MRAFWFMRHRRAILERRLKASEPPRLAAESWPIYDRYPQSPRFVQANGTVLDGREPWSSWVELDRGRKCADLARAAASNS